MRAAPRPTCYRSVAVRGYGDCGAAVSGSSGVLTPVASRGEDSPAGRPAGRGVRSGLLPAGFLRLPP